MRRLAMHEITTRDWSFVEDVRGYARAGYDGIAVAAHDRFPHKFHSVDREHGIRLIRESGLTVSSLNGVALYDLDEHRRPRPQLERVRDMIDLARDLRAEELLIILGPGAYQRLDEAWRLARDLLGQILPYAEEQRVVLSIETLHPTYLPDWGFPNTIQETLEVLDEFSSPHLGIFLDVYHVWWHRDLFELIERCRGRIHGVHLCDWRLETRHPLNDRAIPGEGIAPVREICHAIEAAGYAGTWDIEIFSDELWATDYDDLLRRCKESFESIWR